MKKRIIAILSCVVIFGGLFTWGIISRRKEAAASYFMDSICNQYDLDFDGYLLSGYSQQANTKYFHKAVEKRINLLLNTTEEEGWSLPDYLDEIIRAYGCLNKLGYNMDEYTPAFEELINSKLSEYAEEVEFRKFMDVIRHLDKFQIYNDNIKTLFQDHLKAIKADVLSENGELPLAEYINNVENYVSDSYYTTILECFPYDELVEYITTNGILTKATAGRGGCYDGKENEYENESYWVDPLAQVKKKKGEVGIYEYKKQYMLVGDFKVEITSEYWYQTAANDPNNSLDAELYCMEAFVSGDYETITAFLKKVNNRNCYFLDGDCYIVEKDSITILNGDMVTIQYE